MGKKHKRQTKNPVLFYFTSHHDEHLYTATLDTLVRRAETVLLEHVSEDLELTVGIENILNAYIRGEFHRPKAFDKDKTLEFFAEKMKGTGGRIFLEKTPMKNPDIQRSGDDCTSMFYSCDLETAMKAMEGFQKWKFSFQVPRDRYFARLLLELMPETALVYIGAEHDDVENAVRRERPTEVHYAFKALPVMFSIKMIKDLKKTGSLSKEYYLRCMMENVVELYLQAMHTGKMPIAGVAAVSNAYASLPSLEQIAGFRNYHINCQSLGATYESIVDSYLSKHGLPPVKEVAEKVLGRPLAPGVSSSSPLSCS